ncbi:GDSL esterase/lipase At2g30220 [Coffea arabica]|uniref:GDSL esterase/lipase At2g30220 n=1 Tax=Coffea arabica TaxID=13443 RepID=A0A6P6W1X5_COFAR
MSHLICHLNASYYYTEFPRNLYNIRVHSFQKWLNPRRKQTHSNMAPSRVLFTILVHLCTVASCLCHNQPRFTAIYAFGDSFADTGNNNFLVTLLKANHAPYGQCFPGRVATGRFSDGKLIPDILASALGIKEFVPPFLDPSLSPQELRTGVSFASAGSGYDELTTVFTNVIPVSKQAEHFEHYIGRLNRAAGEVAARNIVRGSLSVLLAGTSDFLINFYDTPTRQIHYNLTGYQDFLQHKIRQFIRTLYDQGVRKFLIAGLPPVGCFPIQITTKLRFQLSCADDENRDAQSYNQKLISLLAKIEPTLPGAKLVYADIFSPLIDSIIYPSKYGLAITNRGCCGTGLLEAALLCKEFSPVCPNPAQFLFWDSTNPSEVAYKNIAQFLLQHALPQLA